MVTAALVDRQIEDGKKLLHALDEGGVEVDVALWLFEPESETWRLVLSSRQLTRLGPKQAYA